MVVRGDFAQMFGARLQELRATAGFSQRELAARMGTSCAAISNLENGNTAPTLGTLVRLAEALGCNVTDLVEVLNRNPPTARKSRKA